MHLPIVFFSHGFELISAIASSITYMWRFWNCELCNIVLCRHEKKLYLAYALFTFPNGSFMCWNFCEICCASTIAWCPITLRHYAAKSMPAIYMLYKSGFSSASPLGVSDSVFELVVELSESFCSWSAPPFSRLIVRNFLPNSSVLMFWPE